MKKFIKNEKIYAPVIAIIFVISVIGFHGCKKRDKFKTYSKIAGYIVKKLSRKLHLNDSQKQALIKIKDEFISKMKANREIRNQIRAEVIKQVRSESINKEKLFKVFDKYSGKRVEMQKFFLEKLAEFHAVLNVQQREKLAKLIEKRKRFFH